ncbi:hypothetical protein ACFL2F_02150, partial [Myxococcota bacterium]
MPPRIAWLILLLVPGAAPAQNDDTVSIAVRYALPADESPSAVTVLTREQIENTHCTDIECLMRQVPGVD